MRWSACSRATPNSKHHPSDWDITIEPYGYRARWNLSKDSSLWIMTPGTVEEVGCIHTCQGLELETIGVIIGPDLAVRDGEVVTVPSARARTDQSLKGYKVGLICDPAGFAARRTRSSATLTAL
jgi:uncharacterized protein